MSSTDGLSVASSRLSPLTDDFKVIHRELKAITETKKLKQYIMEHLELLDGVSTELLNSYHNCEESRIVRRRGILSVQKVEDNRYKTITSLRNDINELKSIILKLIEQNNLHLE
jgi:hypothetical protein